MRLSIVIPCFNEELVVGQTFERLNELLIELGEADHEIIFVDDGSTDNTGAMLRDLCSEHQNIRAIFLSRNFGHQMAATAGLRASSGDAVVLMDADLQDPPEVIAEMLEKWNEGYQVAYGVRDSRDGESGFKILTAKIFYRLINYLSETNIPTDTGDFRLMDRSVIKALMDMPERDRFIRGMVSWIGFRQTAVHYTRAPRAAGRSKYPFVKMLRFAVDGILSFSIVPLKLAVWVGFISIGLAVFGILLAVLERVFKLYDVDINRGWASLFIAVLFMGGVQLLTLGIIGEYLGRIYTEVKRRPLYVIQELLGFDDKVRKM